MNVVVSHPEHDPAFTCDRGCEGHLVVTALPEVLQEFRLAAPQFCQPQVTLVSDAQYPVNSAIKEERTNDLESESSFLKLCHGNKF